MFIHQLLHLISTCDCRRISLGILFVAFFLDDFWFCVCYEGSLETSYDHIRSFAIRQFLVETSQFFLDIFEVVGGRFRSVMTPDTEFRCRDVLKRFQVFWICEAFDGRLTLKKASKSYCLNKNGDWSFMVQFVYFARALRTARIKFKAFDTRQTQVFKGWIDSWVFCCKR